MAVLGREVSPEGVAVSWGQHLARTAVAAVMASSVKEAPAPAALEVEQLVRAKAETGPAVEAKAGSLEVVVVSQACAQGCVVEKQVEEVMVVAALGTGAEERVVKGAAEAAAAAMVVAATAEAALAAARSAAVHREARAVATAAHTEPVLAQVEASAASAR